jgi:hypothetical protein
MWRCQALKFWWGNHGKILAKSLTMQFFCPILLPQIAEAGKAPQKDLIRFDYEKMYTYFGHG